jgi:hypothetical protein
MEKYFPESGRIWQISDKNIWPLDSKLFSNPSYKWAESLPYAAKYGFLWLRDWNGPYTT